MKPPNDQLMMCVATRMWPGWEKCVQTWMLTASTDIRYRIVPNMNVMDAYQDCFEFGPQLPIFGLVHDDVEIYEQGWDQRVLKEFNDHRVGMVGFTGALGHGHPDLYSVPYHLPHLARQDFMSNMRSWAQHGKHFTGERDVAVCDGCAIFVRREILEERGGWPLDTPYGYWMYAEWLCCETRRQGYRIRLVGVDFEHLGGRTSTIHQITDDYEAAHWYFYQHNQDVLPYRVAE